MASLSCPLRNIFCWPSHGVDVFLDGAEFPSLEDMNNNSPSAFNVVFTGHHAMTPISGIYRIRPRIFHTFGSFQDPPRT